MTMPGGGGPPDGLLQRIRFVLDDENLADVESRAMAFGRRVAGAIGIAFTIERIIAFGREAMGAFVASERAANDFRVAAERIGQPIERVRDDLQAIQRIRSPFGDERTINAMTSLVLITQNYDLALAALPVVMDLSISRHIELERAAMLVGRALNGNTTLALRMGIQIKDGIGVLAQFREANRGALESMTPWDKASTSLATSWHRFKEALGASLIAAGGGAQTLDVVSAAIETLTKRMKESESAAESWGAKFRRMLKDDIEQDIRNVTVLEDVYYRLGEKFLRLRGWLAETIVAAREMEGEKVPDFMRKWAYESGRAADEMKRLYEETDKLLRRVPEGFGPWRGALLGGFYGTAPYGGASQPTSTGPGGGYVGVDVIAGKVKETSKVLRELQEDIQALGQRGIFNPEQAMEVVHGWDALIKRAKDLRDATTDEAEQERYQGIVLDLLGKRQAALGKVIELTQALHKAESEEWQAALDLNEAILRGLMEIAGVAVDQFDAVMKRLGQLETVPDEWAEVIQFMRDWIAIAPRFGQALDVQAYQDNIDFIDERILFIRQRMGELEGEAAAVQAKIDALPPGVTDPELQKRLQMLQAAIAAWDAAWTSMAKARAGEVQRQKEASDEANLSTGEAVNQINTADEKTKAWTESLSGVLRVASEIAAAFLGVADALGLTDDNIRKVVSGLGSASSIVAHGFSKDPKTGMAYGFDFTSIMGLVGSGISILSGLFGGGESPEEKAHREALVANNERLADLRTSIEHLTLSLTGAEQSAIAAALQSIIDLNTQLGKPGSAEISQPELAKWLRERGITWADFTRAASELGITLTPGEKITFDQLKAYAEALGYSGTAGGPEASFSEQLANRRTAWGVATKPPSSREQLQQYLNMLAAASPELFGAYRNLDLSDPAMVALLQRGIAEMGKSYADVGIPVSALGGLTEAEFRQAIEDVAALAKEVGVGGEETGVKERASKEFGEEIAKIVEDASKRGGKAAEQGKKVADAYQHWLTVRETALGGPEGALAQEAYQQLQEEMGKLDDLMAVEGITGDQTAGYSVQRTFTVEQGDIVAGELRTANVWLERIEGHLAAMRGLPGGLTVGQLHVTAPTDTTDPQAWGVAAAVAFAGNLDKVLGQRYQQNAVLAGGSALP